MFNFSEWLKVGIIDGYKKGYTPLVKVTEMTAFYLSKGYITDSQVEEIMVECPPPLVDTNENATDEEINLEEETNAELEEITETVENETETEV